MSLRRLLAGGTLLSVLALVPIFAQSIPLSAQLTDLHTRSVHLVADAPPNEGGVVQVLTADGRRLPYTEANLRAAAIDEVVGKVDGVTGQPVGAQAVTTKIDCDLGSDTRWNSCIYVDYYYTGSYIVTNIESELKFTMQNVTCGPMTDRYTNIWKNISTKQATIGPPSSEECYGIDPSRTFRWYGNYTTDFVVGANTRFHTTWSDYDDASNGHPIVWVP